MRTVLQAPSGDVVRERAARYADRVRGLTARQWLDLALSAMAAAVGLSVLAIVTGHLSDRYHILADFPWEDGSTGAGGGVMMALAQSFHHGQLYPPLYADGAWAGTRYAPLPIVLYGAFSWITGEYVVSGKLLAALAMAGVLFLLFRLLRFAGAPRPMAFALLATVLLSTPGLHLATAPLTGDALAVAAQLGSLAVVVLADRRDALSNRTLAWAGLLCAVAVACKASALWAPVALAVWLFVKHRSRLLTFLAWTAGTAIVLFGFFTLISGGEMISNFRSILLIATEPSSVLRSVQRLGEFVSAKAELLLLLAPFAALAAAQAVRQRRWSLPVLALAAALPLTLVVISDAGAQANHLIDLLVLVPLVVGELWFDRPSAVALTQPVVAVLVAFALLIGGYVTWSAYLRSDAKAAVSGADPRYDAWPFGDQLAPSDHVLSSDPYVAVHLDQPPTVLDPWILANIGRARPDLQQELAQRVAAGEYTKVVLAAPLETAHTSFAQVWFGEPVYDALCQHYALVNTYGGYYVYAPNPKGTACTAS